MEIDNLSVSLKTNGAEKAIEKILQMADAVDKLAKGVNQVDGSKLESFAQGLKAIKGSVPTAKQATNMTSFTTAIKGLSDVISGANITQFSSDLSNLSNAVQGMGGKSANALGKATAAMQTYTNQAKQAVNATNGIAKNAGNITPQSNTTSMSLANNFKQAYAELSKVAISATSIGGKLTKMGALVPTNKFKALQEQTEKIKAKYDDLRNEMAKGLTSDGLDQSSKEYQKQAKELEGLRNEYDRLILKQKELALAGDGFKLNPTLQAGLDGFKKGFNGVISVVKNGFVGAIKSANSQLKSFVKNITGANSAQKALQKTMSSMKALPTKIAKEITRLGKMLKLMVVRTALRAVIKEVGNGFQSLAIHSDQFNESMSNLINGSKQLGYSFSAMISPLINALAPALVYIIDLLTKLLNIINQVFSALTGASTWNKAKKFTDSWRDSITGAGKAAGKTAKELKKTVLGFDELNQLQENKNSGGGSGSDITDMFETVPIDSKWKDFAKWLKEMWENKDFYDLGKLIGEKLRDTLESIPWDKIRQTSNDLGKCVASLINGLVEVERLGYDIGYTLAQGVNTVFEFFNGFVHELHWDSIGKFIADTFNGFFENIDWDLIKDTVITGLRGVATSIWNFIQEFHWDNISNFIKNGLDTIAKGIKAFFGAEGYDERGFKLNDSWAKRLGKELGHQLQLVFEDKELWREIGQAMGEMLQGALDFLSGFIKQLKAEDIRQALKELVDGFFDIFDSEELGRTLADIIDLAVDVAIGFIQDNGAKLKEEGKKLISALWDNIDPETKTTLGLTLGGIILASAVSGVASAALQVAKMKLGESIITAIMGGGTAAGGGGALLGSATVAGSSIAGALVGGLIAFLVGSEVGKKAGELLFPEDKDLYEKYEGIKGSFELLKDFFMDFWPGVGYYARDFAIGVKRDVTNAATWVNEKWTEAANKLAERWDAPLTERVESVRKSFTDFKETVGEKMADIKTSINDKVNDAKAKFGEWKDDVKQKKDDIAKSIDEMKDKIRSNFDDIKSKVNEFASDWRSKLEDAKSNITTFTQDALSKFSEFKQNTSTYLSQLKTDFDSFKDNVAKAFSSDNWTFNGVKEGLKKTFEDAKDAIKGVWNSIAEGLNGSYEIGSTTFHINFPTFASGGFPEDGLFFANHNELVGEFNNGKTAVANNEQILRGIENGVYNAVTSAMSQRGSSQPIDNTIYVDGEVLARVTTRAQEKRDRRYSPQTT